MRKTCLITIIAILALTSCSKDQPKEEPAMNNPKTTLPIEEEIFYHVFQRSFYDSDGDLHGDFNGITQKLDYLQDLGITSILLLPVYPSNFYHNYFAYDFEGVDPEFGTMEDYLKMVRAIHDRGMKVYMDTEYQYLTENHKWYKDAHKNPSSKYSDHLVFKNPDNTNPESAFIGLSEIRGYNDHKATATTLNLNNPKVRAYITEQYKFWVDPNGDGNFNDGVDGFRIDHMMDDLDDKGIWTGLFESLWAPLFKEIKAVNPEVKFIAEQANWNDLGTRYFEESDVDIMFGFRSLAALSLNKTEIEAQIDTLNLATPAGKYQFFFLENHDLDRVASKKGVKQKELKLMALINFLSKGIPMIYYGQEIGMKGTKHEGMTDGNDIPRREAFEWYASGKGDGMAFWYKDSGPWWDKSNVKKNDGISVEEQENDEASLLNFYRKLLKLRNSHKAFQYGDQRFISHQNDKMLVYERNHEDRTLLVVCNLGKRKNTLRIASDKFSIPIRDKNGFEIIWSDGMNKMPKANGGIEFKLGGHGFVVLNLNP